MKSMAHPRWPLQVLLALLVSACCLAQDLSIHELQSRIAYADKHFAACAISGSQTDRGKVYIHLGPPDQIKEVKATPNGDSFPWEEWTYRSIPGIGKDVHIEFVDTALDFGYKMIAPAEDSDPRKAAQARRRFEMIQKRIHEENHSGAQHPDSKPR